MRMFYSPYPDLPSKASWKKAAWVVGILLISFGGVLYFIVNNANNSKLDNLQLSKVLAIKPLQHGNGTGRMGSLGSSLNYYLDLKLKSGKTVTLTTNLKYKEGDMACIATYKDKKSYKRSYIVQPRSWCK